jgi:uncharacterized membrane protein (UPF0127 family)
MYSHKMYSMRTAINIFRYLFPFALLISSSLAFAQVNAGLPTVELKTGIYRIQAEIADTPERRQTGLMNRTSMPMNSGMLFVFEEKAGHCFWMFNTKISLSIAFIADDGKIVNIEEMQAEIDALRAAPVAQPQAEARAGGDKGNKGDEAADAAVAMINLLASARAIAPGGTGRS